MTDSTEQNGTFVFERDPQTDSAIPVPVGRILLAGGHVMRLYFGPSGVIAMVPKLALSDEALVILGDFESVRLSDSQSHD